MKWFLQTEASVALIVTPARGATVTPSVKQVAAAETEELQAVCGKMNCHVYTPIQPSVRRLKCNVIASGRVSCRFLWRMSESQEHWLRYGEYTRDGENWHVYRTRQFPGESPQPVILPPNEGWARD